MGSRYWEELPSNALDGTLQRHVPHLDHVSCHAREKGFCVSDVYDFSLTSKWDPRISETQDNSSVQGQKLMMQEYAY
jgi:hypothetical protein